MADWSLSKMSQWSGGSRGTLSRVVRRNQHEYYECYDSYSASEIASRRRSESRGPVKMNYAPLAEYVKRGLGLQWSPQQISERLKLDYPQEAKMRISHPYTSWERGLNENTARLSSPKSNGLIRQYFPKKTDFAMVSHHAVAKVEWKLNNRPRKCLGYRTPEEVLAMSLSCPAGVALQI